MINIEQIKRRHKIVEDLTSVNFHPKDFVRLSLKDIPALLQEVERLQKEVVLVNNRPNLIAETEMLKGELRQYRDMTMFRCPSCAEAENLSGYTCIFGSMITRPDCAEEMVCPISGEECEFEPIILPEGEVE